MDENNGFMTQNDIKAREASLCLQMKEFGMRSEVGNSDLVLELSSKLKVSP